MNETLEFTVQSPLFRCSSLGLNEKNESEESHFLFSMGMGLGGSSCLSSPTFAGASPAAFFSAADFNGMEFESVSSPIPNIQFIDSPSSSSLSPNSPSPSEEEQSNKQTCALHSSNHTHPTEQRGSDSSCASPSPSLSSCAQSSSSASSRCGKRKSDAGSILDASSRVTRPRRKKIPISTNARLAAQRKYDEKKRVLNRRLFDNLKESLESVDRLWKVGGDSAKRRKGQQKDEDDEEEQQKSLADLSSREMIVKAAESIKLLNSMKASLQTKLQHLDEMLVAERPWTKADTHLKQEVDNGRTDSSSPSGTTTIGVSMSMELCPGSASSSTTLCSASSLSEIDSLLYSISSLSRLHQEEIAAVQLMESRVPRTVVGSYAQYFTDFAVMGMDSSVAFLQMDSDVKMKPISDFVNSRIVGNGLKVRQCMRDPYLSHLHALCFLLNGRFSYHPRDTQQMTSASSCSPSAESIVQSVYDSARATTELTDDAVTASKVDESDILSHPLGACALPVASFEALLDTLKHLVEIGKESYLRELEVLYPVLLSSVLRVFTSRKAVKIPIVNLNNDVPLELTPTFAQHPLFLPSYEYLVAMYELYTGKKSVVKLPRPVPSTNNRVLRADVYYSLIRHPTSNLPLAHMLMVAGSEWGEEISKVQQRLMTKSQQLKDLFSTRDYYQFA